MADEGKKTRRKPLGPRQAKPLFLLVSYTDENGNPFPLDASRIKVTATKNAEEVASIVMSAAQTGGTIPAMVRWTPTPTAA